MNVEPPSSIHIEILRRELNKRTAKNRRYSLRAYARFLEIHISALSRIFSGKQDLTPESGVNIAFKLQLGSDERRKFIRSILQARETRDQKKLGDLIESPNLRPAAVKLTLDEYKKVARLSCLALLELTKTRGFQSDANWIADTLRIEEPEVEEMIRHLVETGLLVRENGGSLVNGEEHRTAVDSAETNAVRKQLQLDILESSRKSLERDAFSERLHYGMTMAINPSKIEFARGKIMSFIETLADELEVNPREDVYQLAVSLFPLSKLTPHLS